MPRRMMMSVFSHYGPTAQSEGPRENPRDHLVADFTERRRRQRACMPGWSNDTLPAMRKPKSATKPASRATRQRLSQSERRVQLLGGALADAANVGLGRLTHAGVARECGVAVPTVFSYFENRAALVIATVVEVRRFYLELAGYWHRPEIPPLSALKGHLSAYTDSINTDPHYARVWLEWCTAVRNEDGIWDLFLEYHEQIIKLIGGSIRRGQKSGDIVKSISATNAARLLVSSGITITQLHFMHRDKREINRFLDQSLMLALHHEPPVQTHKGS